MTDPDGQGLGCTGGTGTASDCTEALSSDKFWVWGKQYQIQQFWLTDAGALQITLDSEIPEEQRRPLTFTIWGEDFGPRYLHTEDAAIAGGGVALQWSNTGLSWSDGDQLRFALHARRLPSCTVGSGNSSLNPTDLRAFAGNGVLTLAWVNPVTDKYVNYMVRWKKTGTNTWLNRDGSLGNLVRQGPKQTIDVTGLENGASYEAQVRVLLSGGRSAGLYPDPCESSEWVSTSGTPQPPSTASASTVWSATLTVKDIVSGTNRGCFDGVSGSECSTAANLNDNDFTYGGVDHQITVVSLASVTPSLVISFDRAAADDADRYLILEVDGTTFPLSDSTVSAGGDSRTWTNTGLSWSVGDTVSLSLKEVRPTELTVTASGPLREGGTAVNVFLTLDQPAGTEAYAVVSPSGGPATYNLPRFVKGARTAVMVLKVPEDDIDNNCRRAVYTLAFTDELTGTSFLQQFAFTVIDNDGAADTGCTGLLNSPYPTTLTLEQVSVTGEILDGDGKHGEGTGWEGGRIVVELLVKLDRPSPFGDTVLIDTGDGTTALPRTDPEGQTADDGYFLLRNDTAPIRAGDDRSTYTNAQGKQDWTVRVHIYPNVWYVTGDPGTEPNSDPAVFVRRPDNLHANPDHNIVLTATSERYGLTATPVTLNVGNLEQHLRGGGAGTPCANCATGGQTVPVSANRAPTVASPLADVTGLQLGAARLVSLAGVFSDPDGDALTLSAASSNQNVVAASVSGNRLTLLGAGAGTATVTVTAEDGHGHQVGDAFEVTVGAAESGDGACDTCGTEAAGSASPYADLIAQMREWRNDPQWSSYQAHTDRWDRALKAFGETVDDAALTAMTAAEAQAFADRGWSRWVEVAEALGEIEAAATPSRNQDPPPPANRAPQLAAPLADLAALTAGSSREVSLSGVFSDPDGDALGYSASSSDETVATVVVDGASLTVTAVGAGDATITVTARDPEGDEAADDFEVAVVAAVRSEPEQSDTVARYDANRDGKIDLPEYRRAVNDYAIHKTLTYTELMEIVKAYTGSG